MIVIVLIVAKVLIIFAFIVRYRKSKRSQSKSDINETTIPLTHKPNLKNYENKGLKNRRDSIDLADFSNYVKNSIKNDFLKQEYMMTFINAIAATYEEIYDSLYFIDMCFTDNIVKKAYVVSKVPEGNKVDYFWNTIWDQNVEHIVLIDDIYSRKTSGNYWTEKNENLQCGHLSVQLYLSEVFADYEYRKFILVDNKKNIKHVSQLRLISWSDIKPPHFPNLVPFFQIMSAIPLSSSSPILVHCRNGIEGTTFALLCDMCLRIAKKENIINIPKTLQELSYHSTKLMIDSVERYIMVHLVLLETLSYIETSVRCDCFDKTSKASFNTKEIEDQKRFLKEVQWRDKVMQTIKLKSNSNYFQVSIPPANSSRMFLTAQDALRIVVVNGFRYPEKFVVIKTPRCKSTSHFFWKFIAEKNITTIVSLKEISASDFDFRPNRKQPLIEPSKNVSIKYKSTQDLGFYDWRIVQLENSSEEVLEHQNIDIISIKCWPDSMICPPDTYGFVKFCAESGRISEKSNSVLVTCSDGTTASGLYVAMMYNIEKMKLENISDVYTSVRNMQFYCSEFVKQEEQFDFLWEAAINYIREFRLYNNFN